MRYKYSKHVPSLLDELDMDELMSKLSDLLLSSGFDNPWGDPSQNQDRTMQALHDAILEALFSDGVLPPEMLEKLFGDPADGDQEQLRQQIEELIEQIIERMKESGYITPSPDLETERQRRAQGGGLGDANERVTFEVTDKALDFLGFKALRDLMGSMGHSSSGRHDTRDLSTGIEASGAPKRYEFGDTMNIDATATILNAIRRQAAEGSSATRLEITYNDLMVAQGEYQSSCATVLMLDCSHSMILYGEDRFTPAKRVAMALSHLIRTQYPGDNCMWCCSMILPRNFRSGRCARARRSVLHEYARRAWSCAPFPHRQRKDMRQIIMITEAAVRADACGWPYLQKCLWARPLGYHRDICGGVGRCESRDHDQYLYAGERLRLRRLRSAGDVDVPWKGLLHDPVNTRGIFADGLHGQEDQDDSLADGENASYKLQTRRAVRHALL